MRIVHTADWHLGRIFHGVHLTEDQAYILDEFIKIVEDVKPHTVVVAGDVYDRAVPPQDAVSLLDDVLSRLVVDVGVTVVLIAGNHDSPERLDFGAKLLANSNLHVIGRLRRECAPVILEDEFGPLHIYPLPFAEPSLVKEELGLEGVVDQELALGSILQRIKAKKPSSTRTVLVAHAAVSGGKTSDSERPLSIGGSETVDPSVFEGFHYVALGHLHQPQSAGRENIRYSGSLLKYSFSEASHKKSVNVIEMDDAGRCVIEQVPLVPRRDVRKIEGTLKEVLDKGQSDPGKDDYIMVTLLDEGPVLDAIGRLREVYPNTLHIERPMVSLSGGHLRLSKDRLRLSEKEMFSSFLLQVTGKEMTGEERKIFDDIIEALRRREREAV